MYRFICDDYKITFKVPPILQEYIDLAEEADRNDDLGNYLVWVDEIDVLAKSCFASGEITEENWDTLILRYCQ